MRRNHLVLTVVGWLAFLGFCMASRANEETPPPPSPGGFKIEEALFGMNPALPSVFVAGDSTAAKSFKRPQWGWAECFPVFFDTGRINVINFAHGGRSSRTYLAEGLWFALVSHAKPGDWVLIQFGHNDATAIDSTQARGSLPGIGEETKPVRDTLTGAEEVVHTYGWYMRQMIASAKAAGLRPVLVTPTVLNSWRSDALVRDAAGHAGWTLQLADQERIPVVDLNHRAAELLEPMGAERMRAIYHGKTHFRKDAAELHARMVAVGLAELPGRPFSPELFKRSEPEK